MFRDAEGIQTALERVKALQEEYPNAYIDDRGTVFNQDVLGAIELGFMLDQAECTCVGALHRTESRGAQYRTDLPGAKRRGVAQAHRPHAQRRRARGELFPGDDHAVAADGADLLGCLRDA